MNKQLTVWKYEGLEFSSKTQRYVTRRFWCVKIDGKTFEGFGTRKEAKEFGERHLETFGK